VVHGDFRPKNAYLHRNGGDLSLLPIDWETAGFGPPAPDLTRIDLGTYWSVVRSAWPEISFATVERWERVGRLLEALAAVNWVGESLRSENAAGRSCAVVSLESVLQRLTVAARAATVLA
jgi:aminoglycoside phosphotransferase (APT) family kinase protein